MNVNKQEFRAEEEYLEKVIAFLKKEIAETRDTIEMYKQNIYRTRREQGVLSTDFTSPGISSDLSQTLLEDQRQLNSVKMLIERLCRDEKLLFSPYYGRFDFKEDGEQSSEKIYVGINNIYDASDDGDILVYDWRAPICSIFYRNELGHVCYSSPDGEICGDVELKRQYKIENSKLKYYFDCSLVIDDEILQNVLGHNASPKMQNIVRTIQSEQDLIIRDTKSDLLITQGAAGSGKTTIALHRIAYLLYNKASSGLKSENIVVISLSEVFSDYIGAVLPELGEKNVNEVTFDIIFEKLTGVVPVQDRLAFTDAIISEKKAVGSQGFMQEAYLFKGSHVFAQIIKRFLHYYENNIVKFRNMTYGGQLIAKSEELYKLFSNDKTGTPPLSRLRRIQNIIKSRIEMYQPAYHKKMENLLKNQEGHEYDYKTVARALAIKEASRVENEILKLTQFDAVTVYRELFSDKQRFEEMCKNLDVPENILEIFDYTAKNLENGINFDDMAPICYISLLLDRVKGFENIRHVVIDEAQDYLPLHYAVFGGLFKNASFTILGDISQSVETSASSTLYDDIKEIIKKKNPILLTLNKSYRSSYEIMNFALNIPDVRPDTVPFERHEKEPEIICCADDEICERLAADIAAALDEGFETAAVICETRKQAKKLYERLHDKINIKLLENAGEITRGAMIVPAFLSKGLEFDCVFIPNVDLWHCDKELSRQLLYIACTRALHRLNLYYGKDCDIIKKLKIQNKGRYF